MNALWDIAFIKEDDKALGWIHCSHVLDVAREHHRNARGGMSVGAAVAWLLWGMSGMELRTSLLKAGVPTPPCSESLGGCCRATSPGMGGLGQMKLGKLVGFPTSTASHRSGGRKCVQVR